MEITTVRYTTSTNDHVEISFDDNSTYTQPYNGTRYRYTDQLNEWMAVPNAITAYDPNYGITDEQLKDSAYQANKEHCDSVILAAESNPVSGSNLDSKATDKENNKRINRAKSKTKLTDADDALADYVDNCYDSLDSADDEVENLNRQALIEWDATVYTYPVWVAP